MFNKLVETYRGKKIFLTGHTGFKGAWLLKIFSLLGAVVTGYSQNPKNKNDLYNLIDGENQCKSIIDDIRDAQKLNDVIRDFQPDFVFHLAAQPLVRYSYEHPLETFEVNSIGTANVLNSIRELNKQVQVILITTDKVYHNNEWQYPYRENDILGGYDPYSASKACAELVVNSFRNSFFNLKDYQKHKISIAVARAGNVIGGGDWSNDRLIPDIVEAITENKIINIRNPNSIRPWQHVLEPLVGYLILGSKLLCNPIKFSTAYNFGPYSTDSLSVVDLVKLSIETWGAGKFEVYNQENNYHEAGMLKLDITKAISELEWEPKMNANQALNETIKWYKAYFDEEVNIVKYTDEQIKNYFNLFP